MRRIIFSLLILSITTFLLTAQSEFYGPYHDGMREALWRADGTQIMTWGNSSTVNVWRDSDGLRLFELNHRDYAVSGSSIAEARWSQDMQTIYTRLNSNDKDLRVFEFAWSAETGDLIYVYRSGAAGNHMPFRASSKIFEAQNRVVTWGMDTLTWIDIDLASDNVGEELDVTTFPNQQIEGIDWNPEDTLALIRTFPEQTVSCNRCLTWFYLMDTDLNSDTFGEILWQVMAGDEAFPHIWHNDSNYLVLHGFEAVNYLNSLDLEHDFQLWDLNIDSATFGTKLFETQIDMGQFRTVLWSEANKRLVIVHTTNVAYNPNAHPAAPPACIDDDCVHNLSIWDFDINSATFGESILEFTHHYPQNFSDPVHLNTSATQLHITDVSFDDNRNKTEILTAYDILTGDQVEATDIIIEPEETTSLPTRPQVDLSNLDNADDYFPIAVNPEQTKVMVGSFTRDLFFIFDIETGEWLLPELLG